MRELWSNFDDKTVTIRRAFRDFWCRQIQLRGIVSIQSAIALNSGAGGGVLLLLLQLLQRSIWMTKIMRTDRFHTLTRLATTNIGFLLASYIREVKYYFHRSFGVNWRIDDVCIQWRNRSYYKQLVTELSFPITAGSFVADVSRLHYFEWKDSMYHLLWFWAQRVPNVIDVRSACNAWGGVSILRKPRRQREHVKTAKGTNSLNRHRM